MLGASLAASAGAEPMIVHPELRLAVETVVGGLDTPSALAFLGVGDFLVLEKNSGRVRRVIVSGGVGTIQPTDALDLAVDNCGERGLLGITLHPDFDLPTNPVKQVYLSYHVDPLASGDGCDGGDATLTVRRFDWDGATGLLTPVAGDPVFASNADSDTLVGGAIGFNPFPLDLKLYVAVGSLGHDGKLQNNHLDEGDLDDTSVIFRLNDDGTTPDGNPFDDGDDDTQLPEERYFAYGVRNPKDLAFDPFVGSLWFTEQSEVDYDEINLAVPAMNGGFTDIQGPFSRDEPPPDPPPDPPPPPDLLFHLAKVGDITVSSYLDPRFSFQTKVNPTGVAVAGEGVGPLHDFDLFVGDEGGALYRFHVSPLRNNFVLFPPFFDEVADAAVDDDPADDLEQPDNRLQAGLLVGTGFGIVSDLETGPDGSVYALNRSGGEVYRVFADLLRDLAVTSVKAPGKVSLSAKKPAVSKPIKVSLVNNGEVIEHIDTADELADLAELTIESLAPGSCAAPVATPAPPKNGFPIVIEPGRKLALAFDVTWDCAASYRTTLYLDLFALGAEDKVPANDDCPRAPAGGDKGCGGKGGGEILTSVTQK
jgi:glucose/arabinose dehydrogenase